MEIMGVLELLTTRFNSGNNVEFDKVHLSREEFYAIEGWANQSEWTCAGRGNSPETMNKNKTLFDVWTNKGRRWTDVTFSNGNFFSAPPVTRRVKLIENVTHWRVIAPPETRGIKLTRCINCRQYPEIVKEGEPPYKYLLRHRLIHICYPSFKLDSHQHTKSECIKDWNIFNKRMEKLYYEQK
jgi:hypothetical protein